MSKPNGKRLKLAEMRQQATEALGVDPGLELEMENGEVVLVPHPLFLSDDAQNAVNSSGTDTVAMAKAILGEEDHEKFLAGGGHSNDVMLAWRLLSQSMLDQLPNGNPTLSAK